MEGLEKLDVVGDISPALEATEDFIHCGEGGKMSQEVKRTTSRPAKQQQEVSTAAMGKLQASGVWGILSGEQEVGPLGLAWADHFSVLGLGGMGLRHGKRSRARSTNDLAKECANNSTNSATNSAFKKGHNRSRSDVNYRPSLTDNGLPAVDGNTLKNMILNQQREAAEKSASSSSVVKQGLLEHREGSRGRWSVCHMELTPCELRLYTLDSSANRQLGTAFSLSHCQSCTTPALGQPADPRTLQALFFNSTLLHLRATCQWEALEWRRAIWETVQAARPRPQTVSPVSPCGLDTRPDRDSPSTDASLSSQSSTVTPQRPTTLPLLPLRSEEVLKAGLLHQLLELSRWRVYTFVLTRSSLQAFPTEGRGAGSTPLRQYALAACASVQHGPGLWTQRSDCFQVVFSSEVVRLRADGQVRAQEWVSTLKGALQQLRQATGAEEQVEVLQGAVLRPRDRKHRETQRAKRQSVTTSFLSLISCLSVEKGLTAQGFKCAGCQRPVGLSRGKAKVCVYSGWYYCTMCHQDQTFLIPARLLHNWDTSRHQVSQQAKEFLEFVYEEPLLDVQQLNPCLYDHSDDLSTVLRLRQQLQSLRAYLFTCRAAVAEDLRRRISPRDHLLQHIHLYSLADLQQVIDGKLAPFLSKIIKFASSHVFSCSLCREKGFICELCQSGQMLYPFQESATKRCSVCGAVFHTECRVKAQPCPRCVRRELHKRPSTISPEDHLPYVDT
ncbi:unnamed protein product [Knipowitschia caucasica]